MTLRPRWPRSLSGQMALLLALALFVAQAINLALALRDRNAFRLAQATRPVATRIADALDREGAGGTPLAPDRGRVRRVPASPVTTIMERHPEVANELRRQLADTGITAGRIDVGLRAAGQRSGDDDDRYRSRRHNGGDQPSLLIAIEQPGRGWLTTVVPWPQQERRIVAALLGQTLILYVVVLAPMLWIGRRIARPLAALADAATRFTPGGTPLVESGPPDVRAVIAAFNALQLRVTGMLEEKDRMLGAIGHDLRTPLAALRVRIESVDDDADRARMAETIDEMSATLDDILSLARLGRSSEPPVEVDVPALVDAVVEDFRDLGADVTLAETGRMTLRLRPNLMRRAVRNLIENAIKYGGGAEVTVTQEASLIAIAVADHGPGITPDRLSDVFDPFVRLEASRNRETGGIGLGLALARAIVREAGGEVTLANRAPHGLTATITLPRR